MAGEYQSTLTLLSDCSVLLSVRDTLEASPPLNWDREVPIDQWEGVMVSGAPPRVTALVLDDRTLSGELAPALGSLPMLTVLSLARNSLSEEIPPELGKLSGLVELSLFGNRLSGAIPDSLGNLSSLQVLFLHENKLSGSIPASLGNLRSLDRLYLYDNQLDGEIPAGLRNLTNLRELDLVGNQLSGPIPDLRSLANLELLALSSNRLEGPVPGWLGGLSRLYLLHLQENQLIGTIPDSIGNATRLSSLSLASNRLEGPIPDALGNLTNLAYLYLAANQLSGEIPPSLSSLENLIHLQLWGNSLEGPIPTWIGNLASLTELGLEQNRLSGSVPESLGDLTNLVYLGLSFNQLTGPIPPSLGKLANLQELNLWNNELTGEIPASLGGLPELRVLNLGVNQLSGAIPEALGDLANLRRLYLWDNNLSGGIPASLANLTNLEVLDLSANPLGGPVPEWLQDLPKLGTLALSENELTGTIPGWLGDMSTLTELKLAVNELTGRIPPSLGNLTNLTVLALSENQLDGEIPDTLGNLSELRELVLWKNQLGGQIPMWLGDLTGLRRLFLHSNELSGPIPDSLGNLSNLQALGLADNQLTGSIPESLGGLSELQYTRFGGNSLTGCVPLGLRFLLDAPHFAPGDQAQDFIPVDLNGDGDTDDPFEDSGFDLPFCLLTALELSGLSLDSLFSTGTFSYTASAPPELASTTITAAVSNDSDAVSITIGDEPDAPTYAGGAPIPLSSDVNEITITVAPADGTPAAVYTVTVTRASDPETAPASGETVTTELVPGWNVAGWMGDQASADALFEAIPQLAVVHAWDAEKQTFLWALPGEGGHSSTLETLTPGMGLWLYLGGTEPFAWTRPLLLASGVSSLQAGWNLVAWGGRDGIGTEEALSHLESSLVAGWLWDEAAQDFREASSGPGQTLARGDALWVEVMDDTQWLQLDGRMRVVFEREVSAAFRAETQAALDDVVGYFARHYNLVVEGITVKLVGSDAGVGYSFEAGCRGDYANGTIVLLEDCLRPAPHEYSRAVQEYLAMLEPGGNRGGARGTNGPAWLSEGVANLAAAGYADLTGYRTLDSHREQTRLGAVRSQSELETLPRDIRTTDSLLASTAVHWLIETAGEQSLYEFYRVRPTVSSWEEAFSEAFGMPIGTFYESFAEHRKGLAALFAHINGRLVEPDGTGVEGLEITAIPGLGGILLQMTTDSAGRFSGATLAETYEVRVLRLDDDCIRGRYSRTGGLTRDRAEVQKLQLVAGEETYIEIQLPRPLAEMCGTLAGRVVGPDGSGVPDVLIEATGVETRYNVVAGTDAAGRFEAEVPENAYEVVLFYAGKSCHIGWYGGADGHTVDREQVNQVPFLGSDGLVIKLPRPPAEFCRVLEGVVVDTSGQPVSDLWINTWPLQHPRAGIWGQYTTPEGAFSQLLRAGTTYEIVLWTGVVEACTVESEQAVGPRAQITVSEEGVTRVRVVVTLQPPGAPKRVDCTAAQ